MMKLTKTKKILVFFGCMFIEEENQSKEDEKNCGPEVNYEKWENRIISERNKLIEKLNQNSQVLDVSDLYSKRPDGVVYNPILFKIHIPFSLQKKLYRQSEEIKATTEDFYVIYDGGLLMIYTMCPIGKVPFGVWDVRDRVEKIFGTFGKVEIVPPTMSPKHITITVKGAKKDIVQNEFNMSINLEIEKSREVKKLLGDLYEDMHFELEKFYEATLLTSRLFDLGYKIESCTEKLLENLTKLLKINSISICNKWKIVNETKKYMAEIIGQIAKYKSNQKLLTLLQIKLKNGVIQKDNFITHLLCKIDWKHYTTVQSTLDIDSVFKSVEHVRSEIESFSVNMSAVFSALVGAVAGSIITLIISSL